MTYVPNNYETVSSNQLTVGDRVFTHGRLFSITAIRVYEALRPRGLVGPMEAVYACSTTLLETYNDTIPEAWATDWVIQGNLLAQWSRVVDQFYVTEQGIGVKPRYLSFTQGGKWMGEAWFFNAVGAPTFARALAQKLAAEFTERYSNERPHARYGIERTQRALTMIKLENGKTYLRSDGTRHTVGGATRDYPDVVFTIQGDWYQRATGRYVTYSPMSGEYKPMQPTWRDLVLEASEYGPDNAVTAENSQASPSSAAART